VSEERLQGKLGVQFWFAGVLPLSGKLIRIRGMKTSSSLRMTSFQI
jgi:hypothetical protein